MHILEHYADLKRSEIHIHATTQMKFDNFMVSEIIQTNKDD